MTSVYIGASGTADFLIGEHPKKQPLTGGNLLIVPAEWKLHLEVSIQKSL